MMLQLKLFSPGSGRFGGEPLPDPDAFQIALTLQFLNSSQRDLASAISIPGLTCLRVYSDCFFEVDLHELFPFLLLIVVSANCRVTGTSQKQMTGLFIESSPVCHGYAWLQYAGSERVCVGVAGFRSQACLAGASATTSLTDEESGSMSELGQSRSFRAV